MEQSTHVREHEAIEVAVPDKGYPVHKTVEEAAEWCRLPLTKAVENIFEFGRRLNHLKAHYVEDGQWQKFVRALGVGKNSKIEMYRRIAKDAFARDPRNFVYLPASGPKIDELFKLPRKLLREECKAGGKIYPTMTLKEIEALAEGNSLRKSKPNKNITPDEVITLYKRLLRACHAYEDVEPIKAAILNSNIEMTGLVNARERFSAFLDVLQAAFDERDRVRKAATT